MVPTPSSGQRPRHLCFAKVGLGQGASSSGGESEQAPLCVQPNENRDQAEEGLPVCHPPSRHVFILLAKCWAGEVGRTQIRKQIIEQIRTHWEQRSAEKENDKEPRVQTAEGADLVWGTRTSSQRKGRSGSGLKGELELARSERHTVPGSLRNGLWGWPCYGKAQEVSVTAGSMLWGEAGGERRAGQARLRRPVLISTPTVVESQHSICGRG